MTRASQNLLSGKVYLHILIIPRRGDARNMTQTESYLGLFSLGKETTKRIPLSALLEYRQERYRTAEIKIICGDCIKGMQELAEGSVDAVIADCPRPLFAGGAFHSCPMFRFRGTSFRPTGSTTRTRRERELKMTRDHISGFCRRRCRTCYVPTDRKSLWAELLRVTGEAEKNVLQGGDFSQFRKKER